MQSQGDSPATGRHGGGAAHYLQKETFVARKCRSYTTLITHGVPSACLANSNN